MSLGRGGAIALGGTLLLVALAAVPAPEGPQPASGQEALDADDECLQAEPSEGQACSIHALQRRAKKLAAEGGEEGDAEDRWNWPWDNLHPSTWKVWKAGQVPELSLPHIQSRPRTGIGFGGGGVRAQILSMGYLRALKRLGLTKKARFLAVNSGSAWAGSVFVYYQGHTQGGKKVVDLDAYLGLDHNQPPLSSAKLQGYLQSHDPWCPFEASFEHQKDTAPDATKAVIGRVQEGHGEAFWKQYVVNEHFKEVGITGMDLMAVNASHKAEIEAKLGGHAILPQPDMPYLSMGCAIIGPHSLFPLVKDDADPKGGDPPFTRMLATPLYTGSLTGGTRKFTGRAGQVFSWESSKSENLTVGGLIETPAFGSSYVDAEVTSRHSREATVAVQVERAFSLADAATCSSYAPSGSLAMKRGAESVVGYVNSFVLNYWAPEQAFGDQGLKETQIAIGDAGVVENFPLIELILRGARCAVMFGNFYVPLDPHYDPRSGSLPADAPVNLDSAAFFFDPGEREDLEGYDYHHNVIFRRDDWPRLINAWKAQQAKGEPMIATLRHVTVENKFWGVPAGREVFVTWVYNSPSRRFMENAFSSTHERDSFLSHWKETYKYDFPYADTNSMTLHSLSPQDVRMMYLHATMLVYDYKETFKRAMTCGALREPWLVRPH